MEARVKEYMSKRSASRGVEVEQAKMECFDRGDGSSSTIATSMWDILGVS